MHIDIELFAGPRAVAGVDCIRVEFDATSESGSCDAGEVKRLIADQYPELATYAAQSRLAIDEAYVTDDHVIDLGQRVALIPPVSGG
ncbi:MAG: MoaD/ThiS family protein [Planctomycetota bacterium]